MVTRWVSYSESRRLEPEVLEQLVFVVDLTEQLGAKWMSSFVWVLLETTALRSIAKSGDRVGHRE